MEQEHTYPEVKRMNPFVSIWHSTRETTRYVIENKPLKYSIILAGISGIPTSLNSAGELTKNFDLSIWLILLGALILGPILGLIGWGISTVLYTSVGKLFGGSGTFEEMAKAMGIVLIPTIWLTPYWIISMLIAQSGVAQFNPYSGYTGVGLLWLMISSIVLITFGIWVIVIQSKAIGEVHQFSSLRGFVTLVIPAIVFGIIAFIIIFSILFTTFSSVQ